LALATIVIVFTCNTIARADDRALAREHYVKGTNAFDLGSYDEAVSEYTAAYRLKNDPALLYNIAQAHRLAGHAADALHFYKIFLSKLPDAPNRSEIETKIAELQKLVEQQKNSETSPPTGVKPQSPQEAKPVETAPAETAAASPATVAQPDQHRGRTKKIAGLVVGAIGLAALAGGIGLSVAAQQAGDALTALDQSGGTFDPAKESAGKSYGIAGPAMIGIGAAALIAGVVVGVLGIREAKSARTISACADSLEARF
jgi:tetratricopeptide (TPR) repeat protein